MAMTEREWAELVLRDAGLPVNNTNITNMLQWMTAEEPTSNWFDRNNPLNSGLDSGPVDGTGSYPNLTVAAHETAATIDGSDERVIHNALADSDRRAAFDRALQAAPWASSHYPDIQGVQAPDGSVRAPDDQVGSRRVEPVAGVKPTTSPDDNDQHRGGHHQGSGHRSGAGGAPKDKKVQVVRSEMDDLSKLLKQGEADIRQLSPLTERALAELKDVTAISELASQAGALTTMVTELQGLLSKLSTGLTADDSLVATTTKKTGVADGGGVPPGLSGILGPGLTKALGHGPSTKHTTGTKAMTGTHMPGREHKPGDTRSRTSPTTSGTKVAAEEKKLVSASKTFLGIPYVYGGDTRSGVDCSGLTMLIYAKALGKNIGRDTTAQMQSGHTVGTDGDWAKDVKLLKPGDLIFYGGPGASGPNAHVVMYIGDGKVIQAAEHGTNVMISPLFSSASADEPFAGVRRYI